MPVAGGGATETTDSRSESASYAPQVLAIDRGSARVVIKQQSGEECKRWLTYGSCGVSDGTDVCSETKHSACVVGDARYDMHVCVVCFVHVVVDAVHGCALCSVCSACVYSHEHEVQTCNLSSLQQYRAAKVS